MGYTFAALETHHATVSTFHSDFDVATEWDPLIEETVQYLDTVQQPVPLIIDITAYKVTTTAMLDVTRKLLDSRRLLNHPMTRAFIVVTNDRMSSLAVSGLSKLGITVPMYSFATLEEALARVEML